MTEQTLPSKVLGDARKRKLDEIESESDDWSAVDYLSEIEKHNRNRLQCTERLKYWCSQKDYKEKQSLSRYVHSMYENKEQEVANLVYSLKDIECAFSHALKLFGVDEFFEVEENFDSEGMVIFMTVLSKIPATSENKLAVNEAMVEPTKHLQRLANIISSYFPDPPAIPMSVQKA